MEEKTKYIQDLSEIRSMMERSSRFISLSGLSGVIAGIYALIGAWYALKIIMGEAGDSYISKVLNLSLDRTLQLLLLGTLILFMAVTTGILLTTRKARKQGLPIWDKTVKLLLINLMIPLATGGILCLILISKGYVGLIAPLTLIFYGLACISASKHTLHDIRYLGLSEIILGLISAYYIGYGIYFWAFGFGVLHILYGSIMYFKYER